MAKDKFPNYKRQAILRDVQGVLESSFRRAGDIVFKGQDIVGTTLVGCDKEGVSVVRTRLDKLLKDYLTNNKLGDMIKARFGQAIYPDEARNTEELIKKAMGG